MANPDDVKYFKKKFPEFDEEEIIEILDGIALYSWRERVQKFLVKVTEIYPNIVRAALIARGLLPLDQSTDVEPLEEDAEFIKSYEERNPQER